MKQIKSRKSFPKQFDQKNYIYMYTFRTLQVCLVQAHIPVLIALIGQKKVYLPIATLFMTIMLKKY